MEGEYRFSVDNMQEVTDALKELKFNGNPVMLDYVKNYYTEERGDEDLAKILHGASLISGGDMITISDMARSLELLISAGEIQPRDLETHEELSEPEEDTRPRDKNGRLLSESQLRYREYREFSETASMAEVNKRKQTDPGYASYVRKQLAAQMQQPVDGAVTPVGDRGTYVEPNEQLAAFARKYRETPSDSLGPRGGIVTLSGGEQMAYAKFVEMVEKCAAIRLL